MWKERRSEEAKILRSFSPLRCSAAAASENVLREASLRRELILVLNQERIRIKNLTLFPLIIIIIKNQL